MKTYWAEGAEYDDVLGCHIRLTSLLEFDKIYDDYDEIMQQVYAEVYFR